MKITGFVGSPRIAGNTGILVDRILQGSQKSGAQIEVYHLGGLNIKGCKSCNYCRTAGKCAISDDMQALYDAIDNSDAIVIGSPIYMWQMTSQTKAFVDRFYAYYDTTSSSAIKGKKVVLAFVCGDDDKDMYRMYRGYVDNTSKMLSDLFGIDIFRTIIATGTGISKSDSILDNINVLNDADAIGAELAAGRLPSP